MTSSKFRSYRCPRHQLTTHHHTLSLHLRTLRRLLRESIPHYPTCPFHLRQPTNILGSCPLVSFLYLSSACLIFPHHHRVGSFCLSHTIVQWTRSAITTTIIATFVSLVFLVFSPYTMCNSASLLASDRIVLRSFKSERALANVAFSSLFLSFFPAIYISEELPLASAYSTYTHSQ